MVTACPSAAAWQVLKVLQACRTAFICCPWAKTGIAFLWCREAERLRIERLNPNPKFPLVRYIGGTWRVGGLLALSRAFGDAYLKGTGQFEGVAAGSDGYSSGFGVIAQPDVTVTELQGEEMMQCRSLSGVLDSHDVHLLSGVCAQSVRMLDRAAAAVCSSGIVCSR